MKDWKACVRTWEQRQKNKPKYKTSAERINEVFERFLANEEVQ